MEESTQPTPRRRQRPALSCLECRRQKVRCDHEQPCGQCLRQNAQCIYGPDGPGAMGREQLGARPAARNRRPTRADPRPSSRSASHQESSTSSPATEQCSAGTSGSTHATTGIPCNHESGTEFPPSSSPLATHRPDNRAAAPCDPALQTNGVNEPFPAPPVTRPPSPDPSRVLRARQPPADAQKEWQAMLEKPRDWGRSRWVGKAAEFSTMIHCYSEIMGMNSNQPAFRAPEAAGLIAQASGFLRKCKNRAKNIKVGRPTRGCPSPSVSPAAPSRGLADEFARLYFASFEATCVLCGCSERRIMLSRLADTEFSTHRAFGPSTRATGASPTSLLSSATKCSLSSASAQACTTTETTVLSNATSGLFTNGYSMPRLGYPGRWRKIGWVWPACKSTALPS